MCAQVGVALSAASSMKFDGHPQEVVWYEAGCRYANELRLFWEELGGQNCQSTEELGS